MCYHPVKSIGRFALEAAGTPLGQTSVLNPQANVCLGERRSPREWHFPTFGHRTRDKFRERASSISTPFFNLIRQRLLPPAIICRCPTLPTRAHRTTGPTRHGRSRPRLRARGGATQDADR